MSAALIVACFAVFGLTAWAALAAGFCAVLVVLSAIDAQHRIVPNRIVLPSAASRSSRTLRSIRASAWLVWALRAAGGLFLVASPIRRASAWAT